MRRPQHLTESPTCFFKISNIKTKWDYFNFCGLFTISELYQLGIMIQTLFFRIFLLASNSCQMNELTQNNWSILDKFDLDLPLSSKWRRIAHVQREFPHFPQELLTLRPFFNLFSTMGSKSLRSHICIIKIS